MSEEITIPNKSLSEIAENIYKSDNIDDDLINMFNSMMLKKNLIRMSKYDTILDDIIDRIELRISDEDVPFSNGQLLTYLETIQKLANNVSEAKTIDTNNVPKIQYNNQVNVLIQNDPVSTLDRDSKERVLNAINSILKDAENEVSSNNGIE